MSPPSLTGSDDEEKVNFLMTRTYFCGCYWKITWEYESSLLSVTDGMMLYQKYMSDEERASKICDVTIFETLWRRPFERGIITILPANTNPDELEVGFNTSTIKLRRNKNPAALSVLFNRISDNWFVLKKENNFFNFTQTLRKRNAFKTTDATNEDENGQNGLKK